MLVWEIWPYFWRKGEKKTGIIANVLNIEIKRLETEEGPGYGAAILAAVGCEVYENVESASLKLSKEKMVIKPEKELAEKYNQRYQKFKELYPEMKELFGKLNQ